VSSKNIAKAVIANAIAKRSDLASLHSNLADAFRTAAPEVRKAIEIIPITKKLWVIGQTV
jgi:hypothetical protein